MNYIILDLEWNQPVNYQSAVYRRVGDRLLFEVIQIGAAKVDDKLRIVDEINILVHPTQYQTIHSRVKRMTGINEELLCDAPEFAEAMKIFEKWCGDDCVYVAWGRDDVSVLQQNMDFVGYEGAKRKMYDLQRQYAVHIQRDGQVALKTAMDALSITPDESRQFHNAMDDAYYTAQVFVALNNPKGLLSHECQPRKLTHNAKRSRFRITHVVTSVSDALASDELATPNCPTCKKPSQLQTEWVWQAQGKCVALSKCASHGLLFAKARFSLLPDGQKGLNLSVLPANSQTKAYVHTKVLQAQYRKSHGMMDDFDVEALEKAFGSNMPFEDA